MNYWIIFILLLSGLIGSGCTKKTSQETHSHTEVTESQKEIWTCPMHPQIRKDQPGKCPICGMDLVRVQALEKPRDPLTGLPEGHAPFELSPMRQQMIGIKYGIVQKKDSAR